MMLLRHAESEFNAVYRATRKDPGLRDPGLTETGRAQAAAVADRLAGAGLRRIVASPYTRTLETATILAARLNLPIEVDATVGERAVFTCDLGTPRSILARRWPWLELDHLPEEWWPPLGETEAALEHRCRRFRAAMAAMRERAGTLVVTHWGFISSLTGHRVPNATLVAFDPTAPHPGGGTVVSPEDPC